MAMPRKFENVVEGIKNHGMSCANSTGHPGIDSNIVFFIF